MPSMPARSHAGFPPSVYIPRINAGSALAPYCSTLLISRPDSMLHSGSTLYYRYIALFVVPQVSWGLYWLITYCIGATIAGSLFLAIHEISHGNAFDMRAPGGMLKNRVTGFIADVGLLLPVSTSFRRYHLDHHAFQGVSLPASWLRCVPTASPAVAVNCCGCCCLFGSCCLCANDAVGRGGGAALPPQPSFCVVFLGGVHSRVVARFPLSCLVFGPACVPHAWYVMPCAAALG